MELLHHKKRVTGRVMAVNHFRPYLYGQEFRLRTDHALLLWLYKRTSSSQVVGITGRIPVQTRAQGRLPA